jgi:hypothetical protein
MLDEVVGVLGFMSMFIFQGQALLVGHHYHWLF